MRIKAERIRRTAAMVAATSLTAAGLSLLSPPAFADPVGTITVCADSCDYTTIQAGIAAAGGGDVVLVGPGTYVENVSVNKTITLKSADGALSTHIVATDGNSTPLGFAGSTSGAVVDGFTITHDYTEQELEDWSFNNNGVTFHQNSSGNTLKNSIVWNNRNGIYLNNSAGNVITDNAIYDNRTGINFTGVIDNTEITRNSITGNWTVGLVGYGSGSRTDLSTLIVADNVFSENWYGDLLIKPSNASDPNTTPIGVLSVPESNSFTADPPTYSTRNAAALDEPSFADLKPVSLGGDATPPAEPRPNMRTYGGASAQVSYAGPKVIQVGGATGYPTIAEGVAVAASGDIVEIAPGTYIGAVTTGKGITLRGAFDEVAGKPTTIITSATSGNGNGVTLSGGSATQPAIAENLLITDFASGIVLGSYSVADHVHGVDNKSYGLNFSGSPVTDVTISHSVFTGNSAGGKIPSATSVTDLEISDSHFDDNTGWGWYSDTKTGAVFDDVTIRNTTFNGNPDKGFYTEKLSNAVLDGVTVDGSGNGRATQGNGININLKFDAFENIALNNVTVTNSGAGELGAGIDIEARNDGSYAGDPASLAGLTITGGTVTGATTGIILGGGLVPVNGIGSTIRNLDLSGNTVGVHNENGPTIDAERNYWGVDPDFATLVSGEVLYQPYWATPAMVPVTATATLSAPTAVVAGDDFTATVAVSPANLTGEVTLSSGSTVLGTKALTGGSASFTVRFDSTGAHPLTAAFTPSDDGPVAEAATTPVVSVQSNQKKAPVPPPAANSAQLDQEITDGTVQVLPPASFTPAPRSGNTSLVGIDPAEPLQGEVAWPDPTDSFVDVYAYSTPIYLGTFPVVDGKVQLNLTPEMLAKLSAGTHRLVFIGQTSGSMQALAITVAGASAGTGALARSGMQFDGLAAAAFGALLAFGGAAILSGTAFIRRVKRG